MLATYLDAQVLSPMLQLSQKTFERNYSRVERRKNKSSKENCKTNAHSILLSIEGSSVSR